MSRVRLGLAAGALVFASIGPALAADWGTGHDPIFRPAYAVDGAPIDDGLTYEFGLRYFYGMGGQEFGGTGSSDSSHALEVHARIDDRHTATYLKGHIGYGAITDGEYTTGDTYATGRVGYINTDFGYYAVDTGFLKAGIFAGYMYSDEAPEHNGLITHGLRLGIAARAQFNDAFDITAEGAIIPYSAVSGTISDGTTAGTLTDISGSLYGAAGEVMAGFKVADNFIIRAGARATYLNGHVTGSQPGEHYVEAFRWGPLVELTGTF